MYMEPELRTVKNNLCELGPEKRIAHFQSKVSILENTDEIKDQLLKQQAFKISLFVLSFLTRVFFYKTGKSIMFKKYIWIWVLPLKKKLDSL